MDSDSLPVSSSPTISQFTPPWRPRASFDQGRQQASLSVPAEGVVCVEIRYSTAQREWYLAPAESDRFVLIFRLSWLPKRVRQACESTRTVPGCALTTHISRADYRSIFHV